MSSQTPSLNIAAQVNAAVNKNVPRGISAIGMDDDVPDFLHCMLYGDTNSRRTTTAALFGGPERTLIVSTRAPEQVRIPLRGLGFKGFVSADDSDALLWAIQSPEKAGDVAGFPEWKDRGDRVLVIDDMTEGAALLVDDNSVRDDGREVKDGRQIYGATKQDVRAAINALQRKKMHVVFTALAGESDTAIYPEMSSGSRKIILAGLEYVFYMKPGTWKMRTQPDNAGYIKKDQFGKDVAATRAVFAKCKIPQKYAGRTPPAVLADEPMDLAKVWEKVSALRGK